MKIIAAIAVSSPSIAAFTILQGTSMPIDAFHASLQRPKTTRLAPSLAIVASQRKKGGICHRRGGASRQAKDAAPTTALPSSAASDKDPYASPQMDVNALAKYAASAAAELALFAAAFQLLDLAVAQLNLQPPFWAAALVFYAASLKSRALNPLNNQRPDLVKAVEGRGSSGFQDRVMPSWTPPGVFFPVMWLLIIGPMRAYSSALIVSSAGSFLSLPTMAFILHLTVGDIWNTINNTEKRYGAAVVGVLFVVLSAANAAYQYSTVDPKAGALLGATCLWLVTAAALVADTWRLNPAPSGERVPLYPVRGEAETFFVWFSEGCKE